MAADNTTSDSPLLTFLRKLWDSSASLADIDEAEDENVMHNLGQYQRAVAELREAAERAKDVNDQLRVTLRNIKRSLFDTDGINGH